MPQTVKEAVEAANAIAKGGLSSWFTEYLQPKKRVRDGDWRPCQFLDSELVRAAMRLEKQWGLVPLGDRYRLGPAGQRIHDAFVQADDGADNRYRVFWGRSKDLRTTMQAVPEQAVAEKKPRLAVRYRRQCGHLLLAARFNTVSGRLLSILCENPALGMMWVPVQANSASFEEAKALCAWFNSTPGALGFLMRRSGTLANPKFSQAQFRELPIPDFRNANAGILAGAFERAKDVKVEPWKNAAHDALRDQLDLAAAATIGIPIAQVRDWRKRLSLEPTVCNRRSTAGAE